MNSEKIVPWPLVNISIIANKLTLSYSELHSKQKKGMALSFLIKANSSLWGGEARKFRDIINAKKNKVLECAHPSPLSVDKFRGNNHFVLANEYLKEQGKEIIDWSF